MSSNTYPLEPAATCTTKTLTTGITGPSEQMVLNSDWAEVETIDLINDGTGLGFGMVGGKSSGVIIKQIIPGGAADRVSITFSSSLFVDIFFSFITVLNS